MIFALLMPENCEQHLKILALIAEKFSNSDYRNKLINAKTNLELYNAAIEWKTNK